MPDHAKIFAGVDRESSSEEGEEEVGVSTVTGPTQKKIELDQMQQTKMTIGTCVHNYFQLAVKGAIDAPQFPLLLAFAHPETPKCFSFGNQCKAC